MFLNDLFVGKPEILDFTKTNPTILRREEETQQKYKLIRTKVVNEKRLRENKIKNVMKIMKK